MSTTAEELADLVTAEIAPPSTTTITITGLIAITTVLANTRTQALNTVGTLAHELGHALTALVTGGGVHEIRIHNHSSGVTVGWWPNWLSDLLTTFAGYAAPPLAGLGVAYLVHDGHAPGVFALITLATVITLFYARDILTWLIVPFLGAGSAAILYWGTPDVQSFAASLIAWLLLVHTPAFLINDVVGAWHYGGLSEGHDGNQLGPPWPVWFAGWFTVSGWAAVEAVPLLYTT